MGYVRPFYAKITVFYVLDTRDVLVFLSMIFILSVHWFFRSRSISVLSPAVDSQLVFVLAPRAGFSLRSAPVSS
jgi:hypothetical protein